MSAGRFPDLGAAPDEFVASVGRRLRAGRPVRRSVPGGWLHIDRPLPFLCVYRCPPDQPVEGADSLVLSQASHLSVSGEPELAEAVSRLVAEIGCLSDRYGAFLVLELWADPATDSFRIHAPPTEPASTVAALAESLKHVDVLGSPADVETVPDPAPAPPGRPPLLSPDEQRRHGVLLLGLEVPGFFLDRERRPYPGVLRRLQHDLANAVRRAVFEFTTVQTSFRPGTSVLSVRAGC